MLSQLIATICGLALQGQVSACTITLQQATLKQQQLVDAKLNSYRVDFERSSYYNKYTRILLLSASAIEKQEIQFTYRGIETLIKKDQVIWKMRWLF